MGLPTPSEIAAMTPMMRQYWELKQRGGDAILFFRMGDFYEIFGSDAELVAPILELVLTSRERGDEQRIPFCGVPHHSARNYWLRLLKRGFKIALADQVEDPATAKGLVKRDIIKILTPGCIDDPEALDSDAPNYVAAAHEDPESGAWSLVLADLSTGELRLGNISGLEELKNVIDKHRPRELLVRRFFHAEIEQLLASYRDAHHMLLEPLPEGPLRDLVEQRQLLSETLGSSELGSQPCGKVIGGEALLAALLNHFRSLQASLNQFLNVRPLTEPNTMRLDETAIRDLELFETARRRDSDGSLFREINQTLSPMGARLLRYFLANPLLEANQIRGRHEAVRALVQLGESALAEARGRMKSLADLERLGTRVLAGSASPQDLLRIKHALDVAAWLPNSVLGPRGEQLHTPIYKSLAVALGLHKEASQLLAASLHSEPRGLGTGSGVFVSGYDSELDQLIELSRSGEAKVDAYQERLRTETGIGSLKIKNHKSYGLLIEVTKTHAAKVPQTFIRRQTMVNCDRFVTVELQELSDAVLTASDRAVQREIELFRNLLLALGEHKNDLRSVAQALATFDLLQSFAWLSLKHGYVEPRLCSDGSLSLRACRHPVVERYVGRHAYTPNDVAVTSDKKQILITGPNMAGKSTIMRQVAITAILNQIGCFVPAQEATLPVFDRIFTRVGASDDLARGQSTFMVEMAESAHILRNASSKSLVILDEVGRGTSTRDGLALAAAILQDLALRVQCYALFATHYHELVKVAADLASVRPMQTEVVEQQETIVFTHRLKDGAVDNSYGLEVARLAGIPAPVLAQATSFLGLTPQSELPAAGVHDGPKPERSVKGASAKATALPLEVLGLEATLTTAPQASARPALANPVLERLQQLNINRLTPIQALNILSELQALAGPNQSRDLFQDLGY